MKNNNQSTCLWCGRNIECVGWKLFFQLQTEKVCTFCTSLLEETDESGCSICHKRIEKGQELCRDCKVWESKRDWQAMLTQNRSLYYYNDFLKIIIAKYKYRGDYELVYGFTTKLKETYRKYFNNMAIVPIPLSKKRYYVRGFNQSEALAEQLGVPVYPILQRIASDQKQSKKTREARFSPKHPMFTTLKMPRELLAKDIVIVDDIYTTGATIRHAARALKAKGTANVHALTVARS